VDPETLKELPQGESGEIVMSGPQIFKGYWKRPEATASAFIERDGKSFFRSQRFGGSSYLQMEGDALDQYSHHGH